MATNIIKLKKDAVAAGMSKRDAMSATRADLEAFIAEGGNGSGSKKSGTKAVKKAVAKKRGSTTAVAKKKRSASAENKSGRKPARKAARKQSAPAAQSRKSRGEAKRRTRSQAETNGLGRLEIGTIDWTVTSDEWNPRSGSPVERLFKALKKYRGNVDKAFDLLLPNIADFVGAKKRDGSKRTKQERQDMLRYRLNRTKFEYARRTGQHESADAENRAEYGTGEYATTRKKRARKSTSASSTSTTKRKPAQRKQASTKRTTPNTRKRTAQRKRTTATAGRKPGQKKR